MQIVLFCSVLIGFNHILFRHRHLAFLSLLIAVGEIYLGPLLNLPLNDDWAYAIPVKTLFDKGVINIGSWPAMTLVAHTLWAWPFCKLLGFSFLSLHLAGLVVSLIGVFVLFQLLRYLSNNNTLAFTGAMVYYFNPLVFNLAHTYMTDLSFSTALLLCCMFAYKYFNSQSLWQLTWFYLSAATLVFIRQYGIIVPVAFTISILVFSKYRNYRVWIVLALNLLLLLTFIYYENYLQSILPKAAAYKFSGGQFTNGNTLDLLLNRINTRWKGMLFHALWYTFPFSLLVLPGLLSKPQWKVQLLSLLFSIFIIGLNFDAGDLVFGNVFSDTTLGTSTFYQDIAGTGKGYGHSFSGILNAEITPYKYFGMVLSLWVWLLLITKSIHEKTRVTPLVLFIFLSLMAYVLMLLITETYFDRYHIPFFCWIILIVGINKQPVSFALYPSMAGLLAFVYISFKGTKDYYDLKTLVNNTSVEIQKTGIEANCINAGLENYMYAPGERRDGYDFGQLHNFEYLIQYQPEPGFELVGVKRFRHRLRYCNDSICIYRRSANYLKIISQQDTSK